MDFVIYTFNVGGIELMSLAKIGGSKKITNRVEFSEMYFKHIDVRMLEAGELSPPVNKLQQELNKLNILV